MGTDVPDTATPEPKKSTEYQQDNDVNPAETCWKFRLAHLLEQIPPEPMRTALPAPHALLDVQGLVVAAPGARVPAVRGASFRLESGQAAGIAEPSASGKSSLARALAGVWPPTGGAERLDGAELEQYGAALGRHVGYLPQEVVLFDGTVAQNIARMDASAKDEDIVAAAKRTGAHEMMLFPDLRSLEHRPIANRTNKQCV